MRGCAQGRISFPKEQPVCSLWLICPFFLIRNKIDTELYKIKSALRHALIPQLNTTGHLPTKTKLHPHFQVHIMLNEDQ